MSAVRELYQSFWQAFEATPIGPVRYSNAAIRPKTNASDPNYNYMVLGEPLDLGFLPVGTISRQKDRLGVELISSNPKARDFAQTRLEDIPTPNLGDLPATLDFLATETKIEIVWTGAQVERQELWPAHFLWLRLGIHLLGQTYHPHILRFKKDYGNE